MWCEICRQTIQDNPQHISIKVNCGCTSIMFVCESCCAQHFSYGSGTFTEGLCNEHGVVSIDVLITSAGGNDD